MGSIVSQMPRRKKLISKKSLYVCRNICLGSLLTLSWTRKYEFKFSYPTNIINMSSKHISKQYARGQNNVNEVSYPHRAYSLVVGKKQTLDKYKLYDNS